MPLGKPIEGAGASLIPETANIVTLKDDILPDWWSKRDCGGPKIFKKRGGPIVKNGDRFLELSYSTLAANFSLLVGVTHLSCWGHPNHPFNTVPLPCNIIHLSLDDCFNSSVDHLPRHLETLMLSPIFNKNLDNLPRSLLRLHVGRNYNQPVDHLPAGLQILQLGHFFCKSVDHLPRGLKSIVLYENFRGSLDHLPEGLENLQLVNFSDKSHFALYLHYLPFGLKKLEIYYFAVQDLDFLPPHLESLSYRCFTLPAVDHLPRMLRNLTLLCWREGGKFKKNRFNGLDNLPNSLAYLSASLEETAAFDNLPPGLKNLNFFGNLMRNVKDFYYIPRHLDEMSIGPVSVLAENTFQLCNSTITIDQFPQARAIEFKDSHSSYDKTKKTAKIYFT